MKNNWNNAQGRYTLCFNPACPSPHARMFSIESHPPSCRKWIIDRKKCLLLLNPTPTQAHDSKQTALLHTSPIDGLLRFYEWREDATRKISLFYEKMKEEILQFIECSRASKLRELEFLTKEMDGFRGLVLESMKLADQDPAFKEGNDQFKKTSQTIHTMINSYRYSIPALKDLLIYDRDRFVEITNTIKESLKKFNDSVCSEIELAGQFERLKYSDMQGMETMIGRQDKVGDSLYKILGWIEDDYLVERNGKIVEWRCPLCKLRVEISNGIKPRTECHRTMVQHLLEKHFLQLTLCYSHRVSRSVVEEMPYSELIRLMQLYQYDELHIFDGANSKNLRYECNPRCLTVLFVPAGAITDDFQHSYCVASTPEEAAYKITLIIAQVSVKLRKTVRLFNFKRNYYNLYTGIASLYNADCRFQERTNAPRPKYTKREG